MGMIFGLKSLRSVAASLLLSCLTSSLASADEAFNESDFDPGLQCGLNLVIAGYEGTCAAQVELSRFLSPGVRYSGLDFQFEQTRTRTMSVLAVLAFHPLQGSFYLEGGVGWRKSLDTDARDGHEAEPSKNSRGLGVGFRLGNRWKLDSGLTIGLQYLGYVEPLGLVLLGPELGWFF